MGRSDKSGEEGDEHDMSKLSGSSSPSEFSILTNRSVVL